MTPVTGAPAEEAVLWVRRARPALRREGARAALRDLTSPQTVTVKVCTFPSDLAVAAKL